ncbi:hypothetical protein SAMN05216210_1768 [Halopseudomonas salegens]|uniref:Uncharacterized protein n=1 Tax=Halopseudomonas salegens TaxID=1434072 RepID=A0A1H2FSC8_9GAMM|nr:hypothetical protein SAMN05216210_1768 [Halopseudomonas salegens]
MAIRSSENPGWVRWVMLWTGYKKTGNQMIARFVLQRQQSLLIAEVVSLPSLFVPALEYQGCVGTPKTEAVGHDEIHGFVLAFAQDGEGAGVVVKLFDIG